MQSSVRMLNPVTSRVEHYMDALAARQKITASNIANVDTPGYQTKDIDFSSVMNGVAPQPTTVAVDGLPLKPDGNNVNLDREARNLAETSLRFQIASQFLQNQIRNSKSAMQEVRG